MKRSLSALAAFPVLFALVVLAASPGRILPGVPEYRYTPLSGDAYGYYSCARAILSLLRTDAATFAIALAGAAALVLVVRRRTRDRAARLLACVWACGILAGTVARLVGFTGAPQMGWPLVWAIPLLPLRAAGVLSPDVAFGPGLALSLLANAVTVVAVFVLARRCRLAPSFALLAAAAVALWPVLSLPMGSTAGVNGVWQGWLGLSIYTEPLSTALVAAAAAIVAGDEGARGERGAIVAGALLGLATLVRISNLLIVGCVLGALVVRRVRRRVVAAFAAGAGAFAPAVLLFWPKGYPKLGPPTFPAHPFALAYAGRSWSGSLLWHPWVLVVLLVPAIAGTFRVARAEAVLLWASILATALLYTFYEETPLHPRFLFVVLPFVLVLWSSGVEALAGKARRIA